MHFMYFCLLKNVSNLTDKYIIAPIYEFVNKNVVNLQKIFG